MTLINFYLLNHNLLRRAAAFGVTQFDEVKTGIQAFAGDFDAVGAEAFALLHHLTGDAHDAEIVSGALPTLQFDHSGRAEWVRVHAELCASLITYRSQGLVAGVVIPNGERGVAQTAGQIQQTVVAAYAVGNAATAGEEVDTATPNMPVFAQRATMEKVMALSPE